MTKKQKIWLGVFLAMFIIPEILWSPVGNMIYELSQSGRGGDTYPFRMTFLENSDNANVLQKILFLQFLGLFFSAIYLFVIRKVLAKPYIAYIVASILFLLSVVVFFIYGFSTMDNIGL